MSTPKRWLDDAGGGPEQELLRAGLGLDPPAGEKDAIWAVLVAQLPPLPGGGGGGGPSGGGAGPGGGAAVAGKATAAAKGAAIGKGAAVGSGILKSVLVGAGAGLVAVGGYAVAVPDESPAQEPPAAVAAKAAEAPRRLDLSPARGPTAPEPAAPSPPPEAAPSAASAAPAPPPTGGVVAGASAATSAELPGVAPSATPATSIAEESRALGDARAALRRGDAAGALAQLDQMNARFPARALGEEREALAIEALAKSGQQAAARARAEAFLRAHPGSVHAARIQSYAP